MPCTRTARSPQPLHGVPSVDAGSCRVTSHNWIEQVNRHSLGHRVSRLRSVALACCITLYVAPLGPARTGSCTLPVTHTRPPPQRNTTAGVRVRAPHLVRNGVDDDAARRRRRQRAGAAGTAARARSRCIRVLCTRARGRAREQRPRAAASCQLLCVRCAVCWRAPARALAVCVRAMAAPTMSAGSIAILSSRMLRQPRAAKQPGIDYAGGQARACKRGGART